MRSWRILVVDDEPVQRESMAVWLEEDGYTVDVAAGYHEAMEKVREHDHAVCLVDLKMPPGPDGIETMRAIHALRPSTAVIIITAYATVDTAITAIKEGALDYLVKPCDPHELSLQVKRILSVRTLERENALLRRRLEERYTLYDMVSKNETMLEIFDLVRDVAGLPTTVLIQGESGTGKEMIARAIHQASDRTAGGFFAVPCTALAESLLESELFGHEKGAFTDARDQRRGKFEAADGGTLFLDEIGDISQKLQVELLRVLQERRFFRVGGTEEIAVDVRVVAASNRDLFQAVQTGAFRDDLYYRLNVVTIHLPPLRERREDIPLLVHEFLESVSCELGKSVESISDEALRLLMQHDWPGNVRELRNAVERGIVVCRSGELRPEDLAFLARENGDRARWAIPADTTLRDVERHLIESRLARTGGNVKAAAESLGIDRSTLYDKMKRYEIERSEERTGFPF